MADREVVYPVTKDTWTYSGSGSTNYGSDTMMYLGTTVVSYSGRYRWIMVDVPPEPPVNEGEVVKQVFLRMTRANNATVTGVRAEAFTGPWAENTVTSNNQPVNTTTVIGPVDIPTAQAGEVIDVDITGKYNQYGFVMRRPLSTASSIASFYTRESDYPPEIVFVVGAPDFAYEVGEDSPALHYTMDDTQFTSWPHIDSPNGLAVSLDGTKVSTHSDANATYQQWAWEGIIRTTSQLDMYLTSYGTSSETYKPRVTIEGGKLVGTNSYTTQAVATSTTSINDGEWHHVAVQVVGGYASVWVDGVKEATSTTRVSTTSSLNGSWYMFGSYSAVQRFIGDVDEYVYYDRAVDDEVFVRHAAVAIPESGQTVTPFRGWGLPAY